MKNFIYITMLFILMSVFSACSVRAPITKVSESISHFDNAVYKGQEFYVSDEITENETYRVFNQASTGFNGTSGIRLDAENRAKNFCRKIGKNMLKLSEHTAKPPYIFGNFPRIEIIFACIDQKQTNISTNDKYTKLSKIKALLDNGVLTQKEFEAEKKKLLK
jgi:hypothetical protein